MRTKVGHLLKRNNIYHVVYEVNGKRQIRSLHVTTMGEAQKARDDLLMPAVLVKTKCDILHHIGEAKKLLIRCDAPINTAWEAYVKCRRASKAGEESVTNYQRQWGRFTKWLSEKQPAVTNVFDTDEHMALDYGRHLENLQIAPETFNQHVKTLRMVFQALAMEHQADVPNPFLSIPTKSRGQVHRSAFTKEEVDELLALLDDESRIIPFREQYAVLFAVGAFTGLRLGDACLLRWSNVDLKAGTVTLMPRKTKTTGRSVEVPVNGVLKMYFERAMAWKDGSIHILPQIADAYTRGRRTVVRHTMRIIKDAGINTRGEGADRRLQPTLKGFHSLRHYAASYMASEGIPITVLSEILGDSQSTLQKYYTHATSEAKQRAVAALTRAEQPSTSAAAKLQDITKYVQSHQSLTQADLLKLIAG